jgi:hypothetical protein
MKGLVSEIASEKKKMQWLQCRQERVLLMRKQKKYKSVISLMTRK